MCVCVCVRERGGAESVCLSRVCLQCWALSGGSSPDQNKEKSLHEYTSPNTFQDAAQQHVGPFSLCYHPQSFGFLSVGDTQKLLHIQVQLMKRQLTIAFFMLVRSFATIPGRSKECDSP